MILKHIKILVGMLVLVIVTTVSAQEYDFNKLPVINPKPDFNGVDPTSGSYATASPLHFNSPASGNLNFQQVFNGRTESFTLNVYLDDHTYLPSWYSGDPEDQRYIRIHLGGTDKLFWCGSSGDCTQDVHIDGSKLTRIALHEYLFVDKAGAEYKFFPLLTTSVDSTCYDPDGFSGCNMAAYTAYAPVQTITYASGEKLTFSSFSSLKTLGSQKYVVDSISSNLGYQMELETAVAANFTPQTNPGWNWFIYRHLGPNNVTGWSQTKFSLYRGSERINTLTIDRNWSTLDTKLLAVKHTDDLNRSYQVDFHGGEVYRCAAPPGRWGLPYERDKTVVMPIRVRTPAGVVSDIQYHMSDAGQWIFQEAKGDGTSVPAYKVTRGGKTWEYSNEATQKSLKDPMSHYRTVEFSWLKDSTYDTFSNTCPHGNADTIVTAYQDELSRRNTYGYDGSLLERATFPESNGYHYDYDARGNLTGIIQNAKPNSSQVDRQVFRAEYPASCDATNFKYCNKPSWVENAKGFRTDYTYSATHGGVLTVTQPAQPSGVRPQSRYFYTGVNTGDGTVWRNTSISECTLGSSCAGTANELVTTIAYWGKTFLPSSKTQAAGDGSIVATESYSYNSAGLVTSTTDAMGQTSYTIYDVVGRKIGEISADPDGSGSLPRLATRITYNDDDQPTLVEKGTATGTDLTALNAMTVTQSVVTTYDALGRKSQDTVLANGQTFGITQYSYNAWGKPLCTAKRMNFSGVPQDACTLGTKGVDGYDRITKNEYDVAGQLVKVYHAYGTPIEQVYAAYEYSENGKKITVIDANENKARLEYDGYDRQTHWYFPSKIKSALLESNTDYEEYGYDLNDNRTSLRKRDGTVFTYSYDNLDRVIKKIVPERTDIAASHTQDVFYDYDNRGLVRSSLLGAEDGQGITQTWDALGRMSISTINLDGVPRTLTHTYNLKGVRTQLKHPDNQVFIYNHDYLYRLTSLTNSSAGTLASYTFNAKGQLGAMGGGIVTSYGYDGVGRVESLAHNLVGSSYDNTYSYGYNPASQLLSLTTTNTNYTPVNGQQNQTYEVNGLNQYVNVGGLAYEYDGNGNLTFDGQTRYSYDPENRLVKATTASGTLKAELWYDPMGRLYKMQSPSATTHFLYDGDELIAEFNGTGTSVQQRYIHGISVDDPVVWFQGSTVSSSTRKHLRTNHQGSIVAVSDYAGNKLYLPRYDNWGKPQGTPPLRFGYTGQAWLAELGLWHYKARMYSPTLGRFLQTDPVGYEDQVNLYAYVGNDPVNKNDPNGKWAHIVVAGGLGFVAGTVVNASLQYWRNGSVDITDALAAGAGAGLASAAIAANPTLAANPSAIAGISAITSTWSSATADVMNGQSVNVEKAAVSAVAGALGAPIGAGIGNAVENALGADASSVLGEFVGAATGEAAGVSLNASVPAVGDAVKAVSEGVKSLPVNGEGNYRAQQACSASQGMGIGC